MTRPESNLNFQVDQNRPPPRAGKAQPLIAKRNENTMRRLSSYSPGASRDPYFSRTNAEPWTPAFAGDARYGKPSGRIALRSSALLTANFALRFAGQMAWT
jgi:hypothetical protein